MAETKLNCIGCGVSFIGPRPNCRYCTERCKWRAKMADRRLVGGGIRPEHGPFTCLTCARSYTTSRPNGEGEKYCSVQCAAVARRTKHVRMLVARERKALRRIGSRQREIAKRARILANRKVTQRKKPIRKLCQRSCASCAVEFATYSGNRKRCDICQTLMEKSTRRASRKKHKTIRRMRVQVKAEAIDPIKVFERDHWRCHICKRKTPKELRGTYEALAPELDHVVTLADGGTHTWSNVKCACRQCNIAKGSRSFGQIGLNLAA